MRLSVIVVPVVFACGIGASTVALAGPDDGDLVVEPMSVDFGDVARGAMRVRDLAVTNAKRGPRGKNVRITAIRRPDTASCAPFELQPSAALPITMMPNQEATWRVIARGDAVGSHSCAIEIADDDGNRDAVSVSMTVVASSEPHAAFSLEPPTGDFGALCQGQTASRRFTLTSTGSADIVVSRPTLDGGADVFAVSLIAPTAAAYPITLRRSQSVIVDVAVAARGAGVSSATLAIPHDAAAGGASTIALSVTSIGGGVGATPSSLAFAQTAIGDRSSAAAVEVTNCGEAPIEIIDLDISGGDAAAFDVGGTLPPPTLPVPRTGTLAWMVAFAPQHPGAHVAALEIVHDGGTLSIPLIGLGAASTDEPAGDDIDPTYYACSSGAHDHRGGVATAALVLLAFACRRSNRESRAESA